MVLLSHPTGNAFVHQAALAFAQSDMLAEFWTCLAWKDIPWKGVLPKALVAELQRRSISAIVAERTRLRPWKEAARLLSIRLRIRRLVKHESGPFSVDSVYRDLDGRVARQIDAGIDHLKAVYAYEDGARETFRAAKRRGLTCVYDLPIGYWKAGRRLLSEEAELEPEWAATLHGNHDFSPKLARKEDELQLADRIIVASSFTRETLKEAGSLQAKVDIIPYGSPITNIEQRAFPSVSRPAGCLRVLFVGSLGQRKGTAYLLRAVGLLGTKVTLTLIGTKPAVECRPLDEALAKHRWIPSCPRDQVLREMQAHDVLVFPSLFEGFGLVILEALSQGIPVITTPHTGGPDVIEDGVDGFIVPIRSPQAIVEKLQSLLDNGELLAEMKRAAISKAKRHGWDVYRERLVACLSGVIH